MHVYIYIFFFFKLWDMAKKKENITYTHKKKKSIETILEENQILDLLNKE